MRGTNFQDHRGLPLPRSWSASGTAILATSPPRQHPVHECWVDSVECEVVATLDDSFDADFVDLLPCDRCRCAERDADRLTGQKLGRHQRRALLDAPAPDEQPRTLPPSPTRSLQVAHARALRGLEDLGLIKRSSQPFERTKACRRTPLGQAVVEEHRQALADGSRIRWSYSNLTRRCRLETAELIEIFGANLEEEIELRRHLSVLRRQLPGRDSGGDFSRALLQLEKIAEAM